MPVYPKKESLEEVLTRLTRKYGEGTVMRLGGQPISHIPTLPTGSLALDLALGGGGLPYGRIIELYGPEASGKTTIASHVIAEAQQLGGTAAIIDSEHAFDRQYAKTLGVNIDTLLMAQPNDGEQALEIAEELIRSGEVRLVVVDSVAALVPRSELEGDMGAKHVGAQARLMSQALRKLAGVISKTGAILLFVNQLREKIGITFGNPEITPGGRALKFFASVRLNIQKTTLIKGMHDTVIGHRVRLKVVKNKVAPPFQVANLNILYGKGIDKLGEIIDLALSLHLIRQAGSWYAYQEQKLGQGKESVRQWLANHPDNAKKLVKAIKKAFQQHTLAATS